MPNVLDHHRDSERRDDSWITSSQKEDHHEHEQPESGPSTSRKPRFTVHRAPSHASPNEQDEESVNAVGFKQRQLFHQRTGH